MMRKLAAAFLGLLLCIALTGCGPSEKQRAVYNDDSLIAAQSDTYFYVKHLSTQSGTSPETLPPSVSAVMSCGTHCSWKASMKGV